MQDSASSYPLFDAFIFIDWSSACRVGPARPRPDAVWVGELVPGRGQCQETYHQTRHAGIEHVTGALLDHAQNNRRVLIGFDFPYGYPAGFCRALSHSNGPHSWSAVWEELAARVRDSARNVINRFEVGADK